jgi:hypothetical protein
MHFYFCSYSVRIMHFICKIAFLFFYFIGIIWLCCMVCFFNCFLFFSAMFEGIEAIVSKESGYFVI